MDQSAISAVIGTGEKLMIDATGGALVLSAAMALCVAAQAATAGDPTATLDA